MQANIIHFAGQLTPWLLSVLVKSSILLLLSLVATQLMRRCSASLRHFLHSLAIVSILILPFAAGLLPELRLAVLPPSVSKAPASIETNLTAPNREAPAAAVMPDFKPRHRRDAAAPPVVAPANRSASTTASLDSPVAASSATVPVRSARGIRWQEFLLLLWIAGVAICLLRVTVQQIRLRRLIQRAQPVDSITLSSRLRWLCRDLGIRREVVLLASSELDVPIAAGVFDPKIVLSPQSGEWNETRRNAVLCHELAHIKRLDGFTQLLAETARAIYWFNPLVWMTVRAMRYERERACDDYVLCVGTPASDYAHELLEIVSMLRRPQPAAALAMARRSQLEGRVLALLNPRVPHRVLPVRVGVFLTLAVLVIALPVAAARLQERPAPVVADAPTAIIAAPLAVPSEQQDKSEPAKPAAPALAPAEPHEPIAAAGSGANFEYHHNNADDSSKSPSFGCLTGKGSQNQNISSHTDDNGYRTFSASWTGGDCSVEARSSGTVKFNPEATAIESISPDGFFEINQRSGDELRRVRVEPGTNGQLNYVYKVNGTQRDFDGDARSWFSSFLLELERSTGFSASVRVPALLAKGGPQAVLTEIAQLRTDYVRQIYFANLFENATLPGPLLVKALDQARESISTDYSLAQVLLTIARHYDLNDEAQRTAFLSGASKLRTDYEHSRVLIELLKRPNLSPQIVKAALESAKTIGTDYEKSRILTTIAGLNSFDEGEVSTYLDLASSIGTDYEHSRSLLTLMDHQKLSPQAMSKILASASTIGTDYEKSRILLTASQSHNFDEKQIATYLTLVDSIGTDYERSRDLLALMNDHKLANDAVGRIIAETSKIGTDNEKARVLTEAARRYQIQGALRDAYIKAADSIGTEYERNRTLAAITKRELM